MEPIKSFSELRELVSSRFSRLSTPCGIKATVAEIMEFIKKESGSPDDAWVQKTTLDIINGFAMDAFLKVPVKERAVFLPHCLRNVKVCKAPVTEDGYQCIKCGACKIHPIIDACEKRGMRWYTVGGGSQLLNIIKKRRPGAVVGVACFNEIRMGVDQLMEMGIPAQAVVLSKPGCVNTDVSIDDVLSKINLE